MNTVRKKLLLAVLAVPMVGAGVAGFMLSRPATVVAAEPPKAVTTPTDPELERKAFKVADGFEVTLFAAEPMLLKPIGMNWDAQGRLWVAGSETYPQVKPGDQPKDKIFVLEDTDGDGKADKSTVFAEGLFIATSVIPADGGAYVANSTELLFLKDTDGDGKADQTRVVFSGFGTEDTHHVIHGFRWDNAGRMNMLQGIYIGSRVETPYGTKVGLASTLWNFRTDRLDLGIFCAGLINPWGVTWDKYGQAFLTDGAGGEGVNFAPPGADFTAANNASRILKGLNPGSPKYCGAEIVNGRHLPDDWQGDLITNDFRANRTVRFKLSDNGGGFSAKLVGDVITSSDKAYRPVDVKMGPDGAIYIADWYNPIINHGEVDFRDPRRDKVHGRIWRLTAKGRPAVDRPKLAGAAPAELLSALLTPEQWTRTQAKMLLQQAGASAVKGPLGRWWKNVDSGQTATADKEHALLEALWTYQHIDTPEPKLLERLLESPTAEVRAAAARVAGEWAGQLPDAAARVAPLATDDHPRVRIEAVRALAAVGLAKKDASVVPLAVKASDKPIDPFIDFVLYKTLQELKPIWLPAATAGKLSFESPAHLEFALRTVQSADALKKAVADLQAGKLSPERRKDAYDLIALLGSQADVTVLFNQLADAKLEPTAKLSALDALERAARQRRLKPQGRTAPRVERLLADASPAVQASAARLAGLYGNGELQPQIEAKLEAAETPADVREAAASALAGLGAEGQKKLASLAAGHALATTRAAAIAAFARVDAKAAAVQAADYLTNAKPTDDPSPVLAAFLKREGGVEALSAALAGKKLPADTAKLALRYVQGIGVDLGTLGETIRASAGGSGGQAVELSAADMKALLDEVAAKGDAARGEIVFRTQAAACYQCHMVGGVGGPLAPDLRAIGASSPVDYIAESILNPAKAVKDGYAATTVVTKEGDLIQGIKVREDSKELVLRDNLRDEVAVPLSEIKTRKEGGSLMPAGLQDSMTRQEFVDLIRFLSELGKPGPYSVPGPQVVRRWRTIAAPAAAARPPSADAAWMPAYSLVSGVLPAAALPQGTSFVRFEIEVVEPGPVKLAMTAKPAKVWLGEQPVEGDLLTPTAKGVQAVTVLVESPTNLTFELQDVATSKAKVNVVGGR
jgi:putative heme-binding domain-containing protein